MKPWQKALRLALIAAVSAGLAFFFILCIYVVGLFFTLPDPDDLHELNLTESTLIMDRNGELLYSIHGEYNRQSLDDLELISPWLVDATIAIEDDEFYSHIGIDIGGIFKAVLSEIGIGSPRGGSTITQQFVKNAFLTSERSYTRKLKEILLSLALEAKFSKDEILLMYLNAVPYGSNAYGAELASTRYFDKSALDLNLAEAALIAGIPKAPTRYSPYGSYRYTTIHTDLSAENLGERVITGEISFDTSEFTRGLIGQTYTLPDGSSFYMKGRSDFVLDRMLDLEMINQTDYDTTLAEIQNIEFQPLTESIKAPHFVLYIKQLLEDKYGTSVVEQGGLKVYTTLDLEMQDAAEDAIAARIDTNNSSYDAENAAMISLQPQTGQILTMVGSANYFDYEDEINGQVNMITSYKQPASSFKPFIYALAFLNQYTPATVLYDVPTGFGSDNPQNYDGDFLGPVSIREALATSRNITAAKAYYLAGGEDDLIPFLKEFGFDDLNDDGHYGWPLALGSGEVTALQLAEGYGVLANGGIHVEPTAILKIENAEGEILEQWEEDKLDSTQVLDEQVAYLINDILSDESVSLGPNMRISALDNAAKTGTSTKPDTSLPGNTWLAAYTPTLVTITWAGNADGRAMASNASGYNTAAPIWKNFMNSILDKVEGTDWNRPDSIKEVAISRASGKLPSEFTPSNMIETDIFASFSVPTEIDDAYTVALIETVTNRLATEYSPEDVVMEKSFRTHESPVAEFWPTWQADILAWLEEQEEGSTDEAPTESAEDIHNEDTADNIPEIVITSPTSLSAVSPDERSVEIEVDIEDRGNGLEQVVFMLNDDIKYYSVDAPYTGKIRLPVTAEEGDTYEITAKAVDVYGYSGTSTITIRISDDEGAFESNPDDEDIDLSDEEEKLEDEEN